MKKGKTYDQFSLAFQVAIRHSDECIILLTLAQGGRVDISRKETDRRQNSWIEGCSESLCRPCRLLVSQKYCAGLTRWPPRHIPVAAIRPLQLGKETSRSTECVASSSYASTVFSILRLISGSSWCGQTASMANLVLVSSIRSFAVVWDGLNTVHSLIPSSVI